MKKPMSYNPPRLSDFQTLFLEEPSAVPINPSESPPLPLEVQNLSLDMKVDGYFMKYEKESLPTTKSYALPASEMGIAMEQGFRNTFLGLLEAEEDPAAAPTDDPASDPAADPGAPPAAPAAGQPPAIENPRFNARNFAQSVARLILNYEGLLDPKTTILNRARAYVEKNYDASVAKQMMDILASQFQLTPREDPEDGPDSPIAAGSFGGGGGAGGGA